MKSILKMFLVSGLILFGLSAFTACSSDVDDTEPEVPVSEASDTPADSGSESVSQVFGEEALDFTQTTITASPYTYPESVDHSVHPEVEFTSPTYIVSEATVSESAGASVMSRDNIITVTPCPDGLHIVVDCNATEESKAWVHNSLKIKNVTDNHEAIEVGVGVLNAEKKAELTFVFTERNKIYKVWLTHMDVNWNNYGTTEANAVQATARGGLGTVNAKASDIRIEKDSNNKRIIRMNNLTMTAPEIPDSLNVYVRAENGTRWANPCDKCEPDCSFVLANNTNFIRTYTDSNNELNTFLAGKQNLFIILSYKFSDAAGKEYKQDIYASYDKWISDSKEFLTIPTHEFPLITITSTNNGGTNYFVTEPVAHHVKDAQRSWNDLSNVNTPDPWYENCSISVDNGASMAGQVKVRGNWTTNYDKKSLRIKFDSKQNLCGLNGGKTFKNWVLLAVWKDASFLRDAVALKMFKAMFPNYYASDCQLVEVEVNGEYMGVYLLAEQQEVKSDRINITQTDDSAGTDIGYLIEFDKYYTSEVENERFEINYGGNIKDYYGRVLQDVQKGYTIKSDINTAEQKTFIMKYMNRLWRICYDAAYNKKYFKFTDNFTLEEYTPAGANDDEKCKNCISEVIDITSLANMYIYNELVCDPDIYLTSFFMTADFGAGKDRKLRFQAPWDFDSTMGNKRFCTDDTSSGIYVGKNDMFAGACQTDVNCEHEKIHANPWMVIFIKQGWFQQLVREQWAGINRTSVLNTLTSYIDGNSTDEYSAVYNYTRAKWGTPAQNDELCTASKTAAASSQAESAEYLKNWLTARFSAVNSIITGLSTN
ncbi:CotH kinase family protein [Treponema bryantii]|uniref:CotH kinase family protein n=1 Tax=Treponema bryantii TaxID=163 RepID=UPI0003B623CD|nr:CotH kinase family protein [Treponema bryantii]